MPIGSVVLSSLILFPVYRHYYALTLVFCDVSAVKKSNQLTIGIIIFLSCIVFLENSRFISKRMRLIPFENNKVKPFMIGHVGLELILDTLLIKNNSIDANSFYKQLAACDPEIIIEFLKINEIEDAEAFTTFYERFCSIQYLLSYKSNESIVYALNRIQYRLTQQFFTENDTRLMHHHIADLMDIVEHNYLTIFEEIALHLAHEKNNIT